VFQVDVFYPLGDGWADAVATVDDICDLFAQGTVLENDTGIHLVITGAGPGPALPDENWYRVPISVRYTCYSNI
jgi:hypothetical protein